MIVERAVNASSAHTWLASLLAGLVLLPGLAVAEPACRQLTAVDAEALAVYGFATESNPLDVLPVDETYRLGEITVVRQNVFEDEENWLENLANRYNWRTRENVVRSVLPVVGGESVDRRRLEEAERILRRKVYLYDARVIPRRLCGDELDVYVVTRDVWTLTPRVTLARSGGENTVGLGISDSNVIGSGKGILFNYQSDEDRRGYTVAYHDPNVADSRWAMDLMVVDNDDGERFQGSVRYPFFSLDTRQAFVLSGDDFTRDEGLYFLGEERWEFSAQTRQLRVAGGWSAGLEGRFVNRWLFGYGFEEQRFELPDPLLQTFPRLEQPDREFGYPFVAFQRIEDDHEKRFNLDHVRRTEDVSLGRRYYGELGLSSSATGGSGDHLIGRFSITDAAWVTPSHLLSVQGRLNGYYDLDERRSENLVAAGGISYRYQQGEAWSLLVQGSATAMHNPTLDRQLLLGGSDGLRGYPNRYQIGDRRFLVTVEERYYSNLYPWRLFRLGAAAFVDVGRAWYHDEAPAWVPDDRGADHFDVLSNVGVGLRLESTRTRGDLVLHFDVAFPLRSGPDVRSVEVTVSAKQTL